MGNAWPPLHFAPMSKEESQVIIDSLAADGFGHWLAGFIDGEGCFDIRPNTKQAAHHTRTYAPRLTVSLRRDDAAILEEVHRRTGWGLIQFRPKRGTSNPGVVWVVYVKREVVALCDILDHFPLRTKKCNDYLLWREAVRLWRKVRRARGGRGMGRYAIHGLWAQIAEIRLAISDGRRYDSMPTTEALRAEDEPEPQLLLLSDN